MHCLKIRTLAGYIRHFCFTFVFVGLIVLPTNRSVFRRTRTTHCCHCEGHSQQQTQGSVTVHWKCKNQIPINFTSYWYPEIGAIIVVLPFCASTLSLSNVGSERIVVPRSLLLFYRRCVWVALWDVLLLNWFTKQNAGHTKIITQSRMNSRIQCYFPVWSVT